jgi:hypothetical protein
LIFIGLLANVINDAISNIAVSLNFTLQWYLAYVITMLPLCYY